MCFLHVEQPSISGLNENSHAGLAVAASNRIPQVHKDGSPAFSCWVSWVSDLLVADQGKNRIDEEGLNSHENVGQLSHPECPFRQKGGIKIK